MTSNEKEKEIKKEVNEPQVENQPKESFFQRHKKKLIAGACAVVGLAAGAYIYARNSKKAAAPVKETAETESKEAAQINEQPQRGDRDDRRNNNRHGGNRQNW